MSALTSPERHSPSAAASPFRSPVGAGFTLVEIIVVLGIIALLMAVSAPAWRGTTGSFARRSAVNRVMGALDQARTTAITEGKKTYVAFVGTTPKLDVEKWGRACAIFVEDDNFNLTQRSAWILLPTGTSFKISKADQTSLLNRVEDNQIPATAPAFPVRKGTASTTAVLPYVMFDSSGQSDVQNPLYSRILIFEGYISATTGAEVPTRQRGSGAQDKKVVLDEIRINPATGRARYTLEARDNPAVPPTPAP